MIVANLTSLLYTNLSLHLLSRAGRRHQQPHWKCNLPIPRAGPPGRLPTCRQEREEGDRTVHRGHHPFSRWEIPQEVHRRQSWMVGDRRQEGQREDVTGAPRRIGCQDTAFQGHRQGRSFGGNCLCLGGSSSHQAPSLQFGCRPAAAAPAAGTRG